MFRTSLRLSLPEDVLQFEGERFLELVRHACGNAFKELMEILAIDTVHKLLLIGKDILSVFQKNYRELEKVNEQLCLHLDDGTLLLKPGLRMDFDRFLEALDDAQTRKQTFQSDSIEEIFSSLKDLIDSHQMKEDNVGQSRHSFLVAFLENACRNLMKNRNNCRYTESVLHFAQSLYVLGGRNAYEFVRMNLPGSLPGLSALDESLNRAGAAIEESEFRFDALRHHQKSFGYQIACCSEDSTAIVKKICYNATTNSFTGFSTPLEYGVPVHRHFQTDSFDQLKTWFAERNRASSLNVHMIQPLGESPPYLSPFLLAGYGISGSFTAIDVLLRWLWIFRNSCQSNVRIVAFATDCDPRYLLAMRLATGFFAKAVNVSIQDRDDALKMELPSDWSSWFFMRARQLFLCFQDPVHLCTKLRNRILSETGTMLIGKEIVSTEVLMTLIQTTSKLSHRLVKTDIEPRDRQNFNSCLKLSSDDVLIGLEKIDGSQATRVFLRLLRSVVLAYIEKSTSILDRVYHAWLAVFLCRIWLTWLQVVDEKAIPRYLSNKKKDDLFITIPAHFSIEINAHSLLAICLLVRQSELPRSALAIWKYSSQPCESIFRLTRSISGSFSSVVNFTTDQFLKRASKLSVLNELENRSESDQLQCSLQYPKHHKRRRKDAAKKRIDDASSADQLTNENIEKIIDRAFKDAHLLLSELGLGTTLRKMKMHTLDAVSSFARSHFERKIKKVSCDDHSSDSSSDDDDDEMNITSTSHESSQWIFREESSSENEAERESHLSADGKCEFSGMRIVDEISPSLAKSYFCVDMDDKKRYIHKQTACWLLTDAKTQLSADRLTRVQQSSR